MSAYDARCRIGAHESPFAPVRHVVETKANGEAILSELRPVIPGIVGFNPDPYGDKIARALAAQPRVEAGQVWLPGSKNAAGELVPREPWVADFIHELRVFPNGRNDDRVDTFSMAHLVMGMPVWGAA
jgi:predicted phage terminase large subunit-like protein